MKVLWSALIAAGVMLAGAGPAFADISTDVCKVYLSSAKDIPTSVGDVMKKRKDEASFACTSPDSGALKAYAAYGSTWKILGHVCQFSVFTIDLNSLEPVDFSRERGMALTEGDCPYQNDARYVSTSAISGGTFFELKRFWDGLGSQEFFDQAFSELGLKEKADPYLQDVREAFARRPAIALSSVSFTEVIPDTERMQSGYVLRAQWEGESAIELYVDFTPRGLRVLRFGKIIV